MNSLEVSCILASCSSKETFTLDSNVEKLPLFFVSIAWINCVINRLVWCFQFWYWVDPVEKTKSGVLYPKKRFCRVLVKVWHGSWIHKILQFYKPWARLFHATTVDISKTDLWSQDNKIHALYQIHIRIFEGSILQCLFVVFFVCLEWGLGNE